MRIEHCDILPESSEEAVFDLIIKADKEFIPALSCRKSSKQKNLLEVTYEEKPFSYFEMMKQQNFLIVYDGNELVGFMSYRPDHVIEGTGEFSLSNYVTTVIVNESRRGQGLTYMLYQALFERSKVENKPVTTRTWSTNHSHLHILDKLGFETLKRLENDRGEGIDTVYFGKSL